MSKGKTINGNKSGAKNCAAKKYIIMKILGESSRVFYQKDKIEFLRILDPFDKNENGKNKRGKEK